LTLTGSAFTFNKKLWSIFLMNATLSAKLLLIAGIAIHTTTANAQPSDNNNNNTDSSAVSAMNESVNLPNETTEQSTKQAIQQQSDEVEVQRQKAEAELEAMLERERQLEAANEAEEAKIIEESNIQTDTTIEPASDVVADAVKDIERNSEELATKVISEPLFTESLTDTAVEDKVLDTMMAELSGTEQSSSSFNVSNESTSTPYNFERTPLGSGDIFIPVAGDARVFAEFVDKLPAVVNYYTRLSELEVVDFYSESFGEPISQERKRERLTVTYLLGDISTRVVISEQDEQQQVDVIQEESF